MQKWSIIAAMTVATMMAGSALAASSSPQRSAASLECSKEADAKGLHGKMRKEFRSKCKYGFKHPGSSDQQGRWDSRGSKETQGLGSRETQGFGSRETQGQSQGQSQRSWRNW
jgi:hypothetical protein